MTEISPSTRFKVVDVPVLNPGYCFLCRNGNPNGAPFIDTGMSHMWFNEAPDNARDGVVYICVNCVREMAHNLSLVDADIALQVETARLEGYAQARMEAQRIIDDLPSYFSDRLFGTGPDASDSGSISSPEPEEDAGGQQRSAKKSSDANRQTGVNGGKRRSDDVPSDSAAGDLHKNPFDD